MSMKRRAGHAASPDLATPDPPKRVRKRNDDTYFPDHEDVGTTKEIGMKIIRLLRKSQDKNGRNVATHFLDLPSRADYPDYYQHTPMPLSLNIIEEKLMAGKYDTMEKLESDLKRMVQNAKDYNSSKSEIFEDAERIRKALSNFMPKHNPAYQNSDYRAYPTPIPQSLIDKMADGADMADGTPSGPEKVRLVFNKGSRRRQSQAVSTDGEEAPEDLEEAMNEILDELSQQENAINFEEKPSKRDYPEYYKVIERPVAINDVRRMIRKGAFQSWANFAREVRLIWANAKEFNEPGSEIYEMAMELESYFEEKIQARGVAPPVTTRISLSQPKPKQIKLKVGSSTPTPTLPGGTTVDNDSLRRQKEERDQALDRAARTTSRSHTNGSTPIPAIPSNLRRSISVSEPNDVQMSGMNGTHVPQIPDAMKLSIPGPPNIPTPVMDGEPPHLNPGLVLNGDRAGYNYASRSLSSESENPIERKYRDPGKGLEDALIDSVTYMTHPNLPNDPKWKITRYASSTKTQTSSYIYLPHNHFYLRIIPVLSTELRSRKHHKMVVTHNWATIAPAPSMPPGGFYEFRLQPGENVVAVDVIADLKEGDRKEYAPPQLQVDFERVTFYIYLRDRDETQ